MTTATPDPSGSTRFLLLDAWRGLAALMVVLHHAGFAIFLTGESRRDLPLRWLREGLAETLRHCDLGVPLFFVISGYCIAASLDSNASKQRSPWRFLWRRFRRIYPPYWAALLWYLGLILLFQKLGLSRFLYDGGYPYALELIEPQTLNAASWVGNVTLTESWRWMIGGGPPSIFTRVAWSLCYEEQFYFVCFSILLLQPNRRWGVLAISTAIFLLIRIVAQDIGAFQRIEGTFPDLWHEFAIGIAVYWILHRANNQVVSRTLMVGMLVMGGFGLAHPKIAHAPVTYSLAASSFLGLVLIGIHRFDDRLSQMVPIRWLRNCGRISYSMYLIHLPICSIGLLVLYELGSQSFWQRTLISIPSVTILSVLASWLFFRYFEKPFLNPPINRRRADENSLS